MSEVNTKTKDQELDQNQQKTLIEKLQADLVEAEKSKTRVLDESKDWKSKYQTTKKAEDDRAKELEKQKEDKLVEDGQFKQLLEQSKLRTVELEKEIETSRSETKSANNTLLVAKKLAAFENKLGGRLDHDDYLGFVDTDKIVINPETGDIDEDSVNGVVKGFLSKHKKLVNFGANPLPNFDGTEGAPITKKQYDAMSLEDKRKNLSKMHEQDTKLREKRRY